MNRERFHRIRTLFEQLRRLPQPERAAVLSRECGDDAELRSTMSDLLRAADGDTSLAEPTRTGLVSVEDLRRHLTQQLAVQLLGDCSKRHNSMTVNDLLNADPPPLDLLRSLKDFAKLHRRSSTSPLPEQVATVLYFVSVCAAIARHGQLIAELSDDALRAGISWCHAQSWIDDALRRFFVDAERVLATNGVE